MRTPALIAIAAILCLCDSGRSQELDDRLPKGQADESSEPPAGSAEVPPLAIAPFTPAQAKQHQQAWAEHLNVPVVETNSIGMQMTLIPPGEFMMGTPDYEPDIFGNYYKPEHKVRITKPFYMAVNEATVGQFKAFVEAADYKTEPEAEGVERTWRNPGFEQTDEHPVVWVSWNDAVAFCEWLSKKEENAYRLPTEAEWEFSCRSGSSTRWCFGDNEERLNEYAWSDANRKRNDMTKPVGQKLPNGFDLFDMHGNVREWCSDWFLPDYYHGSPADDPEGPSSGDDRVLRGGAFADLPLFVRSAFRLWSDPSSRYNSFGFRPVRTCP